MSFVFVAVAVVVVVVVAGHDGGVQASSVYTRLELETTLGSTKEEIARRDSELVQVKDRLLRIIGERDDARLRSQGLQLENLFLWQKLGQSQDSPTQQCLSSVSPSGEHWIRSPSPQMQGAVDFEELVVERRLSEKGKLLQAVIDTGLTLQTLVLVNPLPQWQHPPPQVDSAQIRPVPVIPNKRGNESNPNDGTGTSPKSKCMKMISYC